ncbi:MAG: hypothetical protein VKJ44_02390, partial [Synechococcus sp.]|nr:hypothetical protein [Synechococcus sp.]
ARTDDSNHSQARGSSQQARVGTNHLPKRNDPNNTPDRAEGLHYFTSQEVIHCGWSHPALADLG